MKVEWQEEDIKCGAVIGKPKARERWIIGYLAFENSARRHTLTSLSDGMVTSPKTRVQLAADLNRNGYMPIALLEGKS